MPSLPADGATHELPLDALVTSPGVVRVDAAGYGTPGALTSDGMTATWRSDGATGSVPIEVSARTQAGWLPLAVEPSATYDLQLSAGQPGRFDGPSALAAQIPGQIDGVVAPGAAPVAVAIPDAIGMGIDWTIDGAGWHVALTRSVQSGTDQLVVWADRGAADSATLRVAVWPISATITFPVSAG